MARKKTVDRTGNRKRGGGAPEAGRAAHKQVAAAQAAPAAAAPAARPLAGAAGLRAGDATLYGLALAGLAALLVYPPYLRGLFFPNEQAATLIVAALCFGAAAAWMLSRRDVSFLQGPMDWLALALVAAYALSFFFAADRRLAVNEVIKTALYFFTYWLASRLAGRETGSRLVLHAFYLAAAGVALAGFLTAVGVVHIKDGFLGQRIYSTMQYPNALASYLAAAAISGLYLWRRARGWARLPYAAGNYVLLLIFLTTGSRGGMLVLPLALAACVLFSPREDRWGLLGHLVLTGVAALAGNLRLIPSITAGHPEQAWGWLLLGLAVALACQAAWELAGRRWRPPAWQVALVALALVAAALAGYAWLGGGQGSMLERLLPAPLLARLRDISLSTSSSAQRLLWTRDAFRLLAESPVFGLGGGAWEAAYRGIQSYFYSSTQVHNMWMQLWVEVGTLGFVVYVGFWGAFLLTAWRNWRRQAGLRRLETAAVAAAALMLGGHAFIDFDLSLSSIAMVMWTMFGLTRGRERELNAEGRPAGALWASRGWLYAGVAAVTILALVLPVRTLTGTAHARRAVAAVQAQNMNRARAEFLAAAAWDPFTASYAIDLARLYQAEGKKEEARAWVAKAVARAPRAWKIHLFAAEVLANQGDFAGARREAALALENGRWLADVWRQASRVNVLAAINLLRDGERAGAREAALEAAGLPPRMAEQVAGLTEAEKRVWPEWSKFAADPGVALNAGIASYLLGEWEEAESLLTAARQGLPEQEKGEATLWLALLAERRGDGAGAEALRRELAQKSPDWLREYAGLRELGVPL